MSDFLEEMRIFLREQPFETIRISEIHNAGEPQTLELLPANPCQNVYSVAKTFTMTAIGLLHDKGLVRLDEKFVDIFRDELPEEGMDERWENVTVEMALTHSLGLPGGFLDIDVNDPLQFTDDYLRYTFTYPLAYDPGTESRYSDGAYYLLSRVVEKKTGISTDNFLWKELLFPMKFREMAWSHCPQGHVMGATGLYIHSADAVKLGQLYLAGGCYEGKQLISEEWARLAVEKSFAFDWDETHTAYYKGGMLGQKLMVFPAQNRAVAMQSYGGDSGVVFDKILQM